MKADTAQAWRAYLTSGSADTEERAHALSRLEAISFEQAKHANSLAAYKRYLQSYPEGGHSGEARRAVEQLRFEQLGRGHNAQGVVAELWELEDFLRSYPRSKNAAAVRSLLARIRGKRALASSDPAQLKAWLDRFPEEKEAPALERRLDQLRFEEAKQAGRVLGLRDYLQRFPEGRHRVEAENAQRQLRASVAGRYDQAQALAMLKLQVSADQRPQLQKQFWLARLESAMQRLDEEGLRHLLSEPSILVTPTPSSTGTAVQTQQKAQTLHAALARLAKKDRAALKRDAELLYSPATGLHAVELKRMLRSADARARRVAAKALGFARDPARVPLLIDLTEDRSLQVAWTAINALKQLMAGLSPDARDLALMKALDDVEASAASSGRLALVALLRTLAGDEQVLPRLQNAADGRSPLAELLLLDGLRDRASRRAPLAKLVRLVRDELSPRMKRLEAAVRGEAIDKNELRSVASLRWLAGHLLAAYKELGAPGGGKQDPNWVGELRVALARLDALLPLAKGHFLSKHPTFIAEQVDEGAMGRAKALKAKLKALDRLQARLGLGHAPHAKAGNPLLMGALQRAQRSPFPELSKRAQALLLLGLSSEVSGGEAVHD